MAVLNDEQVMLRDMAREWADNESPVTEFRKLRKSGAAEKFDADKWRAQSEMGWAGVIVPEAQGGVGMGWLALGVVLEQLGRTLAASPLATTASAAGARRRTRARNASWCRAPGSRPTTCSRK